MNALVASLLALGLMLGMLALLEIGRRMGDRRLANDPEGARAGTGTVESAVLALLGLLIAFTFSGAASRFDARRDLIVQETNVIGTAYLRIDLLPAGAQPALRDLFRRYVDSRLETYRRIPNVGAVKAELARSTALQGEIWTQAVAASRLEGAPPPAAMLLLPALNDMIDITTTRAMAARMAAAEGVGPILTSGSTGSPSKAASRTAGESGVSDRPDCSCSVFLRAPATVKPSP